MDRLRRVGRALVRTHEPDWWFTVWFTAAFAVVQLIGHLHHEMWRDELHCWAVGRNATGLWDLLTGERRYDGHPFLWYYVLHLASRVTRSYMALQVVGGGLAVVAAGLWLRYAPIPRVLRVAFLGSYYLVFEYGIMCRSYTLGLVLTFAFCALYRPYRVRYLALGFILALLSATSLYGMVVALALGVFLFSGGPRLEAPDALDPRNRVALPFDWASGLCLFVAGLVLTVATSWPPPDALYGPRTVYPVEAQTIAVTLGRYWDAMFPFNRWLDWMWSDRNSLGRRWVVSEHISPWLGGGWLALWLLAFRRVPRVLICYVAGVVLISAAQHFIYLGGLRHAGHTFILSLACAWLYVNASRGRAGQHLLHGLLAVNVAVQVVTGAIAFRTDFEGQFSGSLEAAAFIRAHHLRGVPVVADGDDPATPIAVILDQPFLFPLTGETTDSTVFHTRRTGVTQEQLIEHASRLARASGGSSIILVNHDVQAAMPPGLGLTLLHRGGPSLIPDESWRIYEVKVQ